MDGNEAQAELQESRPGRAKSGDPFVLAVLVFLTVAVMVFGVFTMVRSVQAPFESVRKSPVVAQVKPDVKAKLDLSALKGIDTDKDGFSDFDELSTYHTSPYLKDSDSDGYDDKQEVESGHDPLCKSGTACDGTVAPKGAGEHSDDSGSAPASGPSATSMADLETLTPTQVRELLIEKGLPADKVNALDEQALMDLFRQTLEELKKKYADQPATEASPAVPSAPQMTPVPQSASAEPTADQVREFLRKTGQVPEDQLLQVDDQTLLELYRQAATSN